MAVNELSLRIILEKPTAGVDFGLQKGRGSKYETVQTQRSTGEDLRFEFAVNVKKEEPNGQLSLGGPFVQGPKGQNFVYIDIGTSAGQADTVWSRRLKVPLSNITSNLIDSSGNSAALEARVPGTGKDGGPNCATVKPFNGWKRIA